MLNVRIKNHNKEERKMYNTETQKINNRIGHTKYEMQYESQQEQENLSSAEMGFEPIENCY